MKKWGFFLTVWISFFCHIEIQAIPLPETLCYLHPRPDTEWALTTTPIILAFTSEINLSDVRFQVTGNESGPHQGSAIFSDDNRTIRFQPFDLFLTDEMVDVHISGAIDFSYRFRTRSQPVETFQEKVFKNHQESNFNSVDPIQSKTKRTAASINGVSVPSDFPTIRVQQYGETAPGKIFFASTFGTLGNYIVILKNDGTPYFYRRYPGYTNIYSASSGDFKLQPTGVLSAFIYRWNAYIVLDQNYNEINRYQCIGYPTNSHDLVLLPNGHALIIGNDIRKVDMRPYGGSGYANVEGNVIQELDSDKGLFREWNLWDYYEVSDAPYEIMGWGIIDFTHLNSIAVDDDNNLVISSRNISEIIKIDRETGDVIWSFGRANSTYQITDDPTGISYQHHVRPVPNKPDHYTVYDNGNHRFPTDTRAVEFEIDPANKTAKKVWEFWIPYETNKSREMMGSVQPLSNGNTYIDWCEWPPLQACEINSKNEIVYDITVEGTSSYRSKRFEWEGMLLTPYLIVESYNTGIALIFNKFGDEDVDYYNIYGDTHANAKTFLATSEETFAFLNNLQNNTHYYFKVKAVYQNGDSTSGYSNEESVYASFIEPGQNMVQNGDFSSGRNHWSFHESNGASADTEIDGSGQYHIQINSGGTNLWDVQLCQDDLELIQGRIYLFEFDAHTDANRFIEAKIERKTLPYHNYGEIGYSYLTTQKQHFEYEFTMTYANDLDARVVFNCGQSDEDVHLDNVSFKEVTESDVRARVSFPAQFRLDFNYPNPFNPSTEIGFELSKNEKATLKVYSLLGQEIKTLVNGYRKAGLYQVTFDGSDLPSGIYVYKLQTPSFSQMHKMILMK